MAQYPPKRRFFVTHISCFMYFQVISYEIFLFFAAEIKSFESKTL